MFRLSKVFVRSIRLGSLWFVDQAPSVPPARTAT